MDEKEVTHIAELSRIKAKKNIVETFGKIISYVKNIENVLSASGNDVDTHKTTECKNVFRDDKVINTRGEYTESLLSQVKERDGNWVKVKEYDFLSKK